MLVQQKVRGRHKSKPRAVKRGLAMYVQRIKRTALRQMPILLALIAAGIFTQTQIYIDAEAYSIIILILLTAVIYTAMYSGVRQGIISAVIAVVYNTLFLLQTIEFFSLEDQNVRRMLLIGAVLPALAGIIGRLKERNDYFLALEKKARLRAESSEQRLRFMAESMPQKIFTAKPGGKVEYFNPQWAEYSGLPMKKMKKEGWSKLIHADDFDENSRRWEESLRTGKQFQFEHRLKDADGVYRWHLTRVEALRDDAGEIMQWVGSSTDIEDVRRTRRLEASTKRLIEQRSQLLALNRAKDEFISLASHQLRTPATGVKQYVGMLLQGFGGNMPKEQRDMLKSAYESNERQLTIVNDLLQVAQVDAGKVQLRKHSTNLIELMRDVIDEQSGSFDGRQQTAIFKPERKKVMASVDSDRMRMVFENLLDNASKYSPPNKTIDASIVKTKESVVITVKDEGVGINNKDSKKIFQKFSRLDNPLSVAAEGSGLGLYWVKQIIDLHDGTIAVESKPDKGSEFTITLPV